MDVVIIAAGRGSRLNGVVPEWYKPLLVVNGEPLIVQCVRRSFEATDLQRGEKTIIVLAPDNVKPAVELLQHNGMLHEDVHIVVQADASGPVDAVRRGVQLVGTGRGFVLMLGDNVIPPGVVTEVIEEPLKSAVALREGVRDFERFTWIDYEGNGEWIDKEPGSPIHPLVWVGPVYVAPKDMLEFRRQLDSYTALGSMLNLLTTPRLVHTLCEDIGVPEALK